MNDVTFCTAPLTQNQFSTAQEKIEAIVRYLARCEAEKDYLQQENSQRKDH